MVVIYAEKASLAKELAAFLHAGKRIPLQDEPTVAHYEFTYKGEQAILCHGVGHLASLAAAKNYDEKYSKWDLNVFPCIPENFKIGAKQQTVKCLKLVKSLFDKADWIINATDSDREGELIFSYVYQICKCKAPYKRLWITDMTEEKLKYAFNNLIEPDGAISSTVSGSPDQLQMAGRARDISDWLIGTNLTVAATKKYGSFDRMLTVGRVQTPTLNLVVQREKAIKSHVKASYWKLTAVFSSPNDKITAEYDKGNFQDEQSAQAVLSECQSKQGTVKSIEVKHKKESAPLLYNTTQLLIAASEKLDWDAEKTKKILQSIYEKGYVSYPRTSSEHVTEDMKDEITETLKKLLTLPDFSGYAPDEWAEYTSRHFDNSKVGSHTAIIPTTKVPENIDDEDEKQLYALIAKSIIRIIHPKAEIDNTTVIIQVDNKHDFKAKGSVITVKGWYSVDAMPENKLLPVLTEGQQLNGEYELKQGETQPPKRYTEAELLAAMELAGQKLEDEEARTLMKMQKKGLGTDATREPILNSLYKKGYLTKKKKTIYPTELAVYLIDTLPVEDLKSAEMTGELEKKLNDIAEGRLDFDSYIAEIKKTASEWFGIIAKTDAEKYVSENEKKLLCPFCKKKINSFDWGYSCSGYKEGCKFRIGKTIAGKKITENMVVLICQNGKTNIIKGFKSKSGNDFDAYLAVDNAKKEIVFKFPDKK